MRFENGKAFRDWPAKAVTVFGMSGVGKTTLARKLRRGEWFVYSVDYRIGTRYMNEHIVDNFKREAMKVPFLRDLLRSDSIYISSNISFENLEPLSTYLGKPGKRELGGISFNQYMRRQKQHRDAEIAALLDTPHFIDKARNIYDYDHFVCDTGGSLCEVVDPHDKDDPVLSCLTENTLLVYIRAPEDHARTLIERFSTDPKPMYYQPEFLCSLWREYLAVNRLGGDEEVDPDKFAVWGFERLLEHRQPLYEAIAQHHGYAIDMKDVGTINDASSFVDMIARAIDS